MGLLRKSQIFRGFRTLSGAAQDLDFTKNFGDGFVLTPRAHRRRVSMPRETIAVAAVTSEAPSAR